MNPIETVKNIVSQHTEIENIKESDKLTEIGLDSLDLVELTLEIEEALNIHFSSDEILDLKTIKDLLNLIDKKTK
ncbi:MAG: acyl carrier protein [Bacilli bacterium]|nr:acyl carrier protein [Bacilli bacterium]